MIVHFFPVHSTHNLGACLMTTFPSANDSNGNRAMFGVAHGSKGPCLEHLMFEFFKITKYPNHSKSLVKLMF